MNRQQLLDAIAAQIADYREGEVPAPSPARVDRWIRQFDTDVQVPILEELHHVFGKVYITRPEVDAFLSEIATNIGLTGKDSAAYWRGVHLLDIQKVGESQRYLLKQFDAVLKSKFGFGIKGCTGTSGVFIYLDDAIFSGTKVRNDLKAWLPSAPKDLTVNVVTMAVHEGGQHYAKTEVEAKATELKKNLYLHFWRQSIFEDRKAYMADSDLLKPKEVPEEPGVLGYVKEIHDPKHPLVFRTGNKVGKNAIFSSAAGRSLLEQEFLKAGVRVRSMCPQLKATMRPLGYHYFATLGYGALLVTHRNCPNNCPLVFWASAPWFPLFPRKTN